MKHFRILSIVLLLALAVAACSSPAATTQAPAPTTAPVQPTTAPAQPTTPPAAAASPTTAAAPTTAATEAATAAATMPGTSGMVFPTTVASMPAEFKTIAAGKLTFCTDFPYPPQEMLDTAGKPQGVDVEIGNEVANRLKLTPVYVPTVFDSIIAAVTSGKCDAIISAMNITSDRMKQVSMIPYFQAGQAFVTLKGNPNKITGPMDLCGKAAAAESGTTEADYLQGVGDYKDAGLTQECTKAGKEPIKVVVTQKDTDALQQLQAGKVVIYSTDSPVAAYYTVQHPNDFELVGTILQPALEGINLPCGQPDCTTAPYTPTAQAVQFALKQMMADGTYMKILEKWNLKESAVTLQ